MIRKQFAAVVSVGLALTLAACGNGGGDTGTGGETDSASGGSTITVASWAAAADALEETAAAYMEANPGTTINIQRVGHDYANIIPALTAAAAPRT